MAENKTSDDNTATICMNLVLSDEIIEEVLSKLPLTNIIRARWICTKWRRIIHSTTFQNKLLGSSSSSQKSWYLCFGRNYNRPLECQHSLYDQALDQWHTFKSPPEVTPSYSLIAFSSGLVCFEHDHGSGRKELYVCNPITQQFRAIPGYPGSQYYADCCALTMSVGRAPGSYILVVIISKYSQLIETHVYSSERAAWETREDISLPFSKYDALPSSCVICDRVLYFPWTKAACGAKCLCAYDLFSGSALDPSSFEDDLIPMPVSYHRGSLMNMKGKVVMVGWAKNSIQIWHLDDKQWIEVATMPDEYFEELRYGLKFCSGFDETIYIKRRLGKLVVFDMATGQWRWAKDCPTTNQSYFKGGTYFEPRFDAIP